MPHLHLHAVPRSKGDGLRFWLGPRTRYGSEDEAAHIARRIGEAYRSTPENADEEHLRPDGDGT
jgi:histidine triad (HIT) family protein